MLTHREILEGNATWNSDRTAMIVHDTDKTISYAEFDERVNRLANALRERGLQQGDRVMLLLGNVVEFPVSLYACYKLGVIPAPVNVMLARDGFRYIANDLNPAAVIYDAEFGTDLEPAIEDSVADPELVCTGDREAAETFAAVVAGSDESPPPELVRQDDETAYILYTSGTTGDPKGVVFTVETAHHRRQETIMLTGMGPDTVALQLSPWFHAGGLENVIHPPIAAGATIVVTDDFSPETALEAIDTHDVTHVVSVPTVSVDAAEHNRLDEFDLESLDCWLTMGSPLSTDTARTLIDALTPNVYNGYGTTETLIDTCLRPVDLPEHAGTAGRPNVDKQVRVVEYDPSRRVQPTETVPTGERGEVIVSGPTLVDAYYGNAEATRAALREDWFYTGDFGVKDEDGYLTITGRADDMILSGGELVSPIEVEETLEGHEDIESAVVVGHDDEKWGERVTAYVAGSDIDETELDVYCKDHQGLADFKRPREYHFVDEVERTETGKKQRFKYRD